MRNQILLSGGSKGAVLMLHGFPSEPALDSSSEKGLDLAIQISKKGYEVCLIHYEGLGRNKDGNFSFNASIEDSIATARKLLNSHQKLILLGHSWGGYVAIVLNSILKQVIERTILLSPFLLVPPRDELTSIMRALCNDVPHIFKAGITVDSLVSDLLACDEKFLSNKKEIISLFSNIRIYHALNDNEVPIDSSRKICDWNIGVDLKVCDTDHGFRMNRDVIISQILGDNF